MHRKSYRQICKGCLCTTAQNKVLGALRSQLAQRESWSSLFAINTSSINWQGRQAGRQGSLDSRWTLTRISACLYNPTHFVIQTTPHVLWTFSGSRQKPRHDTYEDARDVCAKVKLSRAHSKWHFPVNFSICLVNFWQCPTKVYTIYNYSYLEIMSGQH